MSLYQHLDMETTEKNNLKRGLALFSGGLDSILAIKLMERAGFEIIPLFIYTPFISRKFPLEIKREFISLYGKEFAERVIIHETGEDYLNLVKKPRFGYGKNLNPCIDCKIFFLKTAARYMVDLGGAFVVTGEVIGQRGMSQRKDAIFKIEKESGLTGKVVRPLSLSYFPETILEKNGLIDRRMFPSIRGRDRKTQLDLARRLGIKNFPQPAGGCLLTDPGFSSRLKVLLMEDLFETKWIHTIKFGRLIVDNGIYVVARNNDENMKLLFLKEQYNIPVYVPDFKGPVVAVIRGEMEYAKLLSCKYTKHCAS